MNKPQHFPKYYGRSFSVALDENPIVYAYQISLLLSYNDDVVDRCSVGADDTNMVGNLFTDTDLDSWCRRPNPA